MVSMETIIIQIQNLDFIGDESFKYAWAVECFSGEVIFPRSMSLLNLIVLRGTGEAGGFGEGRIQDGWTGETNS